MYHFRIFTQPNGEQIVNIRINTPVRNLTEWQLTEYAETNNYIQWIEHLSTTNKKFEIIKRRHIHNPIYRMAIIWGLIRYKDYGKCIR